MGDDSSGVRQAKPPLTAEESVASRDVPGGTAPNRVAAALARATTEIAAIRDWQRARSAERAAILRRGSQGPADRARPVTESMEVRLACNKDDFQAILEIRRLVFREEQGLAQNSLVDADDIASMHAMVLEAGRVVSAGRLTPPNARRPEAGIAWVATRRKDRGRGFGAMVMCAGGHTADERGFPVVTLTAQAHAIGFYEDLGFVAYGKRFELGGVEHQQMERRRPGPPS